MSPVTSHQSPVTSHQSPVTSHFDPPPRLPKHLVGAATAVAAAAFIVACGGGGGASSVTMSGTIQSGAAWPQGAKVVVTDSAAQTVCDTTLASDDGAYSCLIPTSAKAPLVVTATHEDKEPMVSVVATTETGTVNVNPATHMVAALLVNADPNDPEKGIAKLIITTPSLASASAVSAQQSAVLDTYTKLAPDAMAGAANPFTGKLTVDGKGMDAVLDMVKVTVTPTGDGGKAEIAIETKAIREEGAVAPVPIKLTLAGSASTEAPAPSTALTPQAVADAKVTKDNSVAQGTTGQINDLIARMNTCYGQSQAERVGTKTTSSAVAADIVSAACKSMFVGNDPSKFLHNSYMVSGSAAFKGIFTNTNATKFSQGNYEYTVKTKNGNTTVANKPMDGDVVFTAKWSYPYDYVDLATGETKKLENTSVDEYTARPDANGKLYLVGNLSNMDASVEPRVEFRDFTHADYQKYRYINTGYQLYVNAKHGYGKVVVTPPKGGTLTLKQISGGGSDSMGLVKASDTGQYTLTGTSMIRMAAAYLDKSTNISTPTNLPRDKDTGLFWLYENGVPKNWADEDLAKISDQGTWKFEAYTNWNDDIQTVTPVATTYRRTLRRAPTLAEIEASRPSWPTLATDLRTQITADSAATGFLALSKETVGKYNVAWHVPGTAKWAPRSVDLWGQNSLDSRNGFDDSVDVHTSWRKATVGCSSTSVSDKHCENSVQVKNGNFLRWDTAQGKGAELKQIQLGGRDTRRIKHTVTVHMRKS